ncbi:hypothetical protein SteCoe_39153 [Stentor coeruleus]|uniref:PIPK domain-containing protein n=1 Tax=Stentor coeruleus TaxID=5963 RepID=A0A1R2AKT1_9CILI|nr:hypothetical protein SteCoe_39153 [Stentor coeruleus]
MAALVFADDFNISDSLRKRFATVIELLHGTSGTIQFFALMFRTKFRIEVSKLIKKAKFNIKKTFHITEQEVSYLLEEAIEVKPIEPRLYSLTIAKGGTFADIFEGLTKNSLITIFTSLSLKYMNEKPCNSQSKTHFFTKNKLSRLAKELDLGIIGRIPIFQVPIEEYFPSVFYQLRVESSCESIYDSLINPLNYYKIINFISEKGGRSGSFVFSTFDEKFIIKTITSNEAKVFLFKLLDGYIERIKLCPQSRLARIYGVFKVLPLKQYVIIMENILHSKDKSYIFDLKGSKVDREVKFDDTLCPPKGVILKDLNFQQLGYKLAICQDKAEHLIKNLSDDFYVLKEAGIMDYSILLGVCDEFSDDEKLNRYSEKTLTGEIISLGIIDLFQEYNLSKVSETAVKSVFNKKSEISSTNPQVYYERICKFVISIFSLSKKFQLILSDTV